MDDPLPTGGQALNGLLAGIYVAFVVAVMPVLRGRPDDTFLRVMNRINDVIVNPAFLTLFLGAPVLALILAAVRRKPLTIAAAVAALAALVITFAVHVPLNDALADGSTRDKYETPWVLWHYFRTGAASVAFALLCIPTKTEPRPNSSSTSTQKTTHDLRSSKDPGRTTEPRRRPPWSPLPPPRSPRSPPPPAWPPRRPASATPSTTRSPGIGRCS